jgi:hypothetical protein
MTFIISPLHDVHQKCGIRHENGLRFSGHRRSRHSEFHRHQHQPASVFGFRCGSNQSEGASTGLQRCLLVLPIVIYIRSQICRELDQTKSEVQKLTDELMSSRAAYRALEEQVHVIMLVHFRCNVLTFVEVASN